MTDYTQRLIKSLEALLVAEHNDPVDKLVVRLLKLRQRATVAHKWFSSARFGFEEDIEPAYHTRLFAETVLGKLRAERFNQYDFLLACDIRAWVECELLFDDSLKINEAPKVVDNVDYYVAIVEICEEQMEKIFPGTEEGYLGNEYFSQLDFSIDRIDPRENVPGHEKLSDRIHWHGYCSDRGSELRAGLLGVSVVEHEHAHGDFGHLPNIPYTSEDFMRSRNLTSDGGVLLPVEASEDETAKRARLERLVAPYITTMPELKTNDLFWLLVERCEEAIAYVAATGMRLSFYHSASGYTIPSKKVVLWIMNCPTSFEWNNSDDGSEQFIAFGIGTKLSYIKTGADVLDHVREHIG